MSATVTFAHATAGFMLKWFSVSEGLKMLRLVIGKLLKKPSAKPNCHTKKNILQQCCVQSCIWQSKQLWQHNGTEQSCLRSRVNGPPLMCLTGHFISTRLPTHETSTHTHASAHIITSFHRFRSGSCALSCWVRQTNTGVSCVFSLTQWAPYFFLFALLLLWRLSSE